MSVPSSRIVCTGCSYEAPELYRPVLVKYVTVEGDSVEAGRAKGWCYDCDEYRDIEALSRDELSSQLARKEGERDAALTLVKQLSSSWLARFWHRSKTYRLESDVEKLGREIDHLNTLLGIASRRRSNARCLDCGSEHTAPIRFSPEDNIAHNFQHACGGNLQLVKNESGIRYSFRVTTLILDEEGGLIGKE